jgi:hypothetical protein
VRFKENVMRTSATPSCSLLDQYVQIFADTIAEEFQLPAREALRRINLELGENPMTQHVRLRLRDMRDELLVRPTDGDQPS